MGAIAVHSQTNSQTNRPEPAPEHLAFDTCEAPSIDAMRAWHGTSPYSSVAVYIGGPMRACANAALDGPGWISTVLQDGWGVIPVYVSPQAPCTDYRARISTVDTFAQGLYEGFGAVGAAQRAGLPAGSPIYLDIEPWNVADPACDAAVRDFIQAWAVGVHYHGYAAGLYSTPSTGIRVIAESGNPHGAGHIDAIWVARWNSTPGNYETSAAGAFAGRRIHQYEGDHAETWGGVTMDVDSNLVEGPVARYSTDR